MEGLTEGSTYEFKIAAANLVGIGLPSDPSELFKCEAWTAPEPGKMVSCGHMLCEALYSQGWGRCGFPCASLTPIGLGTSRPSATLYRLWHHYQVPGTGHGVSLTLCVIWAVDA